MVASPGPLEVRVDLVPDDNAHLHAIVTNDTKDGDGVKGAEVVLTITVVSLDGDSKVFELHGTTDRNGVAHFEKKRNRPLRPGTYSVEATATKDGVTGACDPLVCLIFSVQ